MYVYWFLAYSYLFITPSILISNQYLINLVKKISQSLSIITLINGFQTKFYLANSPSNIKQLINENPELIDILVCNHVSTFDFLILMSYLQYFNIDSFNFVSKNSINYIPGFGLIAYANTDIKLSRNWEKDKDNLGKQLDNIKTNSQSGKTVILIFPEGTRLNNEKLAKAKEFSRSANIPVYDNLLVPKTKGLWFLINHLKKTNKLGRVWDVTLAIPKFLGKSAYVNNVLGNPIGPIYGKIRELNLDFDYYNLDLFKSWLLKNWKIKDNFLKNYKKYDYNNLKCCNIKYTHLAFVSLVCLLFTLCLGNQYGCYYLIISFIIAYTLIIFKL